MQLQYDLKPPFLWLAHSDFKRREGGWGRYVLHLWSSFTLHCCTSSDPVSICWMSNSSFPLSEASTATNTCGSEKNNVSLLRRLKRSGMGGQKGLSHISFIGLYKVYKVDAIHLISVTGLSCSTNVTNNYATNGRSTKLYLSLNQLQDLK